MFRKAVERVKHTSTRFGSDFSVVRFPEYNHDDLAMLTNSCAKSYRHCREAVLLIFRV